MYLYIPIYYLVYIKYTYDILVYSLFCFVSDAQASIWGPPEIYVKKGSTISLTCSVNVHSTPPSSVAWYHGVSVVDFDSQRGGISLETEKTESGTTSRLLITKAALVDSGNYTCVPNNANAASVQVHVLNGKSKYSTCIFNDFSFDIINLFVSGGNNSGQ